MRYHPSVFTEDTVKKLNFIIPEIIDYFILISNESYEFLLNHYTRNYSIIYESIEFHDINFQ